MGSEIDLMRLYPRSRSRIDDRAQITDQDRAVAKEFGFDYFDGSRQHGYGGYQYHPKFWSETVRLFAQHYNLASDARILDVGCAKGFMLKDFQEALPLAKLAGVDISKYAIQMAEPEVRQVVQVADARSLPFASNTFDLVISINTVHNLERAGCIAALREISRVSKGQAFIMVDGWKNAHEETLLRQWVLTAETMLSAEDWLMVMKEAEYNGDYALWTPES